MDKKEMMVKAHKMTREIKAQFADVNYSFQLGLCMAYLATEGEVEMEATRENNTMLNKVITTLENLQEVKFNKIYAEKTIADATKMFNAGWESLEDGLVVNYKNNQVVVKNGNKIITQEMREFRIIMGKLEGTVVRVISEKELPADKKETYLGQAILVKYYTIRRA